MTITEEEREKIREYLGYPAETSWINTITAACNAVSPVVENTIRGHIRQLDRLQTTMTSTVPFAAETFNSGASGTRQFAPGQRMATLHAEANQYIDRLSGSLRLVVHRRIYGQPWSGGTTVRG